MNRLRDHLTDCIGCGCLSMDTCVLSNPDDVFGDRLTGSRLLVERKGGRRQDGPARREREPEPEDCR